MAHSQLWCVWCFAPHLRQTEISPTSELKETHSNSTCICALFPPQDPNEDTEWNDILRKKGILPPKEVPKDDDDEEELALKQQSVGKNEYISISL